MPIPKKEDMEKHREALLLEKLTDYLQRGDCQKESQLVTRMVDTGYDPLLVAAIALKIATGGEKQRPIVQISEVQEALPRVKTAIKSVKKEMAPKRNKALLEGGMVRLTLSAGKSHGISPADVVGTIVYHGNFPGHAIGAITIYDKHTLVDVPQQYVAQALAKAGKCRIRKNAVTLEIA